jgi:hypothetical protein
MNAICTKLRLEAASARNREEISLLCGEQPPMTLQMSRATTDALIAMSARKFVVVKRTDYHYTAESFLC